MVSIELNSLILVLMNLSFLHQNRLLRLMLIVLVSAIFSLDAMMMNRVVCRASERDVTIRA